jgi:primosomal protein N' (replication factor Y)
MAVVRVQLEDSAAMELDYLVPPELVGKIAIGSRVMVPLQRRQMQAVVLHLLSESPFQARLKSVIKIVGSRPMFSTAMLKLAQWIADYYVVPVRQVLRTMLPEAVRNRTEKFITDSQLTLALPVEGEAFEKLSKRAPMQARVLEALDEKGGSASLSELRRDLPRASALLKPLLAAGWVSKSEVRVERDPFQDEEFLPSTPLTLTQEQTVVLECVHTALKSPATARPILLHGVTGSGKTEVYLQAIATVLESAGDQSDATDD